MSYSKNDKFVENPIQVISSPEQLWSRRDTQEMAGNILASPLNVRVD